MVEAFTDTTIAFINDGGVRADIEKGEITGEDIFFVLPFSNIVDKVTIKGEDIKQLLEDYASQLCPTADCYAPTFLQMSGLRVVYDVFEDNMGNRVSTMQVKCSNGEEWCDMEMSEVYAVALPSFLANGGAWRVYDFSGVIIEHTAGTQTDYEVFEQYVVANTPINVVIEGRITINYGVDDNSARQLPVQVMFP
jgi:2',3'-cyclic-nucleotide 2'-phosphodiesterase (5'-nucleotidase family)